MRQITVNANEAGQRLDKLLRKILSGAPGGFFYKQMRKKNITLNGKKADGNERTREGDIISLYLSEETFLKFAPQYNEINTSKNSLQEYEKAFQKIGMLSILHEDEHVLIVDKPADILTQKAVETDSSLNEWLIGYLLFTKKITGETLKTFKPSVCNRLDRNTSGMVICGISLAGSQKMSALLKDRNLHKFYRLIVKGKMKAASCLEGYLQKDNKTNKVTVITNCQYELLTETEKTKYTKIFTKYKPIKIAGDISLVEVALITGKTHQIRAHLSSIGFPLLGDYKYGVVSINETYRKIYGISTQMLHAYRLEFPKLDAPFMSLSEKIIIDELPKIFEQVMEIGDTYGDLEFKRT